MCELQCDRLKLPNLHHVPLVGMTMSQTCGNSYEPSSPVHNFGTMLMYAYALSYLSLCPVVFSIHGCYLPPVDYMVVLVGMVINGRFVSDTSGTFSRNPGLAS